MSAIIYLYKYDPEAIKHIEYDNNYDFFNITYQNIRIDKNKSYTYKKMIRKWKDKIIYWKDPDIKGIIFKGIPVKGVYFSSSNIFPLKKRWYKKRAWLDILIDKKSLENWMKKYIKSSSWIKFRKEIIDIFQEGDMFLEISW